MHGLHEFVCDQDVKQNVKQLYKEPNIANYDRVTEILSPFSGLSQIDPDVVRNAGNRGSVVHKIAESLVYHPFDLSRPGKFDMNDLIRAYAPTDKHFAKEIALVKPMVESFEAWLKIIECMDDESFTVRKFLPKPDRFYDNELMITGECDFIYEDHMGRLVLADLKTPTSESSSWMLQGSAYSWLAKKAGYEIDIIEFVQLSRKGSSPKIYHYKEDFELFRSHLNVYRYQKSLNVDFDHTIDYL